MKNSVDSEDLRKQIFIAFKDAVHPGGGNIVLGPFPPQMPDYIAIYNLYKEHQWHSFKSEFFYLNGEIQSSINFLTPKAFFYYLPAFMIYIISDDWTNDVNGLIADLLSALDYKNKESQPFIFTKMNGRQKECIRLFLNFIFINNDKYTGFYIEDLRQLIDNYWSKLE